MSAYSARVLADGARFYWRLGEAAGVSAVDAAATLNATHLGAVTVGQAGALGAGGDADLSALYGPASARTEAPADSRHQGLTHWTIEAWVYTTGVPGDAGIAGHVYVPGNLPCVLYLANTGKVGAGYYNGSWNLVFDPASVALNTWVHFVATYDGTTIRLFRNGILAASTPASGWLAAPAGAAFRIGGYFTNTQSYPGRLDEVALYPTALSAPTILAHYQLGVPPQTVTVPGVYPTGYVVSITGGVVSGDGHVCGASIGASFGAIAIKLTKALGGVPSAAAFGAVTIRTTVASVLGGVASAQAFGAPKTRIAFAVSGLGSAQALGVVLPRVPQLITFGGVPSAQEFGVVDAFYRWLDELLCLDARFAAICGFPVCGAVICGGESFDHESVCLVESPPAICNQFLCGQAVAGGGLDVLTDLPPPYELDLVPVECA